MNTAWCVVSVLGLTFLSWGGLADTGTWQSPDMAEITILSLDPAEEVQEISRSRDVSQGQECLVSPVCLGTGIICPDENMNRNSSYNKPFEIEISENDTVSTTPVTSPGERFEEIQCPDPVQGGEQCVCIPENADQVITITLHTLEQGMETSPSLDPRVLGAPAEVIPTVSQGDTPVLLLGINETSIATPVSLAVDMSFGSVSSGFFQSVTDARVIDGNLTMTISSSPPAGR